MDGDFSIKRIAKNFVKWYKNNSFTATRYVFDVGITTQRAIRNFLNKIEAEKCGGKDEYDNGNGSLMRIAPLAFYVKDMSLKERYELTKKVSSITHAHELAVMCCSILIEVLINIINGKSKDDIQSNIYQIINSLKTFASDNISTRINEYLKTDKIKGSGFVLDTLIEKVQN